jgi:hypothetical protein
MAQGPISHDEFVPTKDAPFSVRTLNYHFMKKIHQWH